MRLKPLCASRPKKSDRNPTGAPEVGIVYLVGDKLLADTTPLAQADDFSGIAFHELEHERWWAHR